MRSIQELSENIFHFPVAEPPEDGPRVEPLLLLRYPLEAVDTEFFHAPFTLFNSSEKYTSKADRSSPFRSNVKAITPGTKTSLSVKHRRDDNPDVTNKQAIISKSKDVEISLSFKREVVIPLGVKRKLIRKIKHLLVVLLKQRPCFFTSRGERLPTKLYAR